MEQRKEATKKNNVVTILAAIIGFINVLITAFAMGDSAYQIPTDTITEIANMTKMDETNAAV